MFCNFTEFSLGGSVTEIEVPLPLFQNNFIYSNRYNERTSHCAITSYILTLKLDAPEMRQLRERNDNCGR